MPPIADTIIFYISKITKVLKVDASKNIAVSSIEKSIQTNEDSEYFVNPEHVAHNFLIKYIRQNFAKNTNSLFFFKFGVSIFSPKT